jgi:hypothetical protein
MNKKIYAAGIFFSVLCLIMGLCRDLLQLQFENQVILRQSFLPWMIVFSAVYIILLLVLLKYYRYKKYRFASATLLIVIIAFLSSAIIAYVLLTTKRMLELYMVTEVIYSITAVIHFTGLIFSRARERKWLRIAGIAGICFQLIIWPIKLMYLYSTSLHLMIRWVRISEWLSLLGELSLIFLLVNFFSEFRLLKTESAAETIKPSEKYTMGLAGVIILVIVFIFNLNLVNKKEAAAILHPEVNKSDSVAAHFFDARNFVNNKGDTLRYRLMKPLDYDPQKNTR